MLIPIALALSLQAASVSPAGPEPQPEIVVQGTRVGEKQVKDFVEAVTDEPFSGQVGRFHAPACPVALGLPPAQNAAIAARIRSVASAARIAVAPRRCTPNIFLIVTANRKDAIEELRQRYPSYFADIPSGKIRNLESEPSPAVAWQVRSLMTADGQLVPKLVTKDYYVLEGSQNPSRIRAASMPAFLSSMLIVDANAAAGLSVTQLADYAAMRTFAATDPEGVVKAGAPTILGLLGQPDDKPLPLTLTYWDLAFLKSLYSTDNAYYARYQRGDIERLMKQELQHSVGAQREE